ncbi:RWD-domain-containing protein, partial [Aureobasidium sp. EXF-8846]
ERECDKLWDEYGRCQILFSYIDYLQQQAEQAFDLESTGLDLPSSLKYALLDYDASTKKAVFDAGTFDCGICLEPKKGSSCYRMRRCGHVFCQTCLQDFYNNCITEGDVGRVQCLDPTCGKDAPAGQKKKRRKEKTLHPKELQAICLEESMIRRYVDMKRKKKQEADKSTVYCPRTWCQGPARSEKYPPIPQDLASYPESSSEDEDDAEPTKKGHSPSDRLAICSKCTFAFCKTCYAGWHGDFARCWPRNPSELSEEEKASYDYIRTHTSPCPTCSSPTQKTMGCNHMRCVQCATHFCYLCGAWLCPDNPYMHFNKPGTECYQKLWELEEGDEGQEGAFVGARRWEQEALAVAQAADREEAEALQREEDEAAARQLAEQLDAQDNVAAVAQPVPRNNAQAAVAEAAVQQPARRGGGRRPRGGRVAAIDGRRAGPAVQQHEAAANQQQIDAAAAAAFRRFVELAVRDEEDGWDSDELEDDQDERKHNRQDLDPSSHNDAPSSTPELGLYALPLSSDLLLFNDTDITPPASPLLGESDQSTSHGRFIPRPWDEPTLRQRRKIALDSTFSAASDRRKRHSGASTSAVQNSPSLLPTLPRLKSEASRGSVPLLTRPKSRSPSIASLRRDPTIPEQRRVASGLSHTTPAPAPSTESELLAQKNKEMVSKVVLAGLRVWGFTASSKRKKRASTSTSVTAPDTILLDAEEEAKDEEYKLLYHHVYKSTCFAFRATISKQDFGNGKEVADRVRDTVDALLLILCKDPMEVKEDAEMEVGGGGFKGAVVRTPKGELGEEERGLR